MTQEFDSAGLTLIQRALNLSGVDAEQQTFLQDGDVSQVVDVGQFARRSLSPFRVGIFSILLQNTHPGAGDLQSFADPYNPINSHNGYPNPVDPNVSEIWVGDVQVNTTAGPNVTHSMFGYDAEAEFQGVSDTAVGGPVAPANRRQTFAVFNDFTTVDSTGVEFGQMSDGNFSYMYRRRWQAGATLIHRSAATGVAGVNMIIQCYIGPVGMGQDLF